MIQIKGNAMDSVTVRYFTLLRATTSQSLAGWSGSEA